jgi:CHAT domain-containing protein
MSNQSVNHCIYHGMRNYLGLSPRCGFASFRSILVAAAICGLQLPIQSAQAAGDLSQAQPESNVFDCAALNPLIDAEGGNGVGQIVLSYCVEGSALYDPTDNEENEFEQAINRVLAPYQGRSLRRPELVAIQDEITLIYLQQGYLTSRAESVTIQSDGTLLITVVEGFIQDVCALGTANSCLPLASASYARYATDYLDGITERQIPINIFELDERLQRLAQDERFQTENALFRLQIPTGEPLSELWSDNESDLQALLDNPFVPEPGASILALDLQFRPEFDEDKVQSGNVILSDSNNLILESRREDAFTEYFGDGVREPMVDPGLIRYSLHSLEMQEPSIRAAVVYIASEGDRVFLRIETSQEPTVQVEAITRFSEDSFDEESARSEELELDGGSPSSEAEDNDNNALANLLEFFGVRQEVTRDELALEIENLWDEIQDPTSDRYLQSSARLYDLLISPLEEVLEDQGIEVNTLLFVMESGLGLLPVAALYDAEDDQFLAEKYKVSVLPNFGSLDLRPSRLEEADILAMGASEFRDSALYPPLNAVPLELELLGRIWGGGRVSTALNDEFTLENLRRARRDYPYQIVHLATHASFLPGEPGDSSIQLWNASLPLQELQIATLNWNKPPLDLLVLSACQTALGDESAELGFAGLSLQANVKSILASLWYVSDLASLIYMMEFYRALSTGVTKAEAVQNAQLAMLDDQRLKQNLREIEVVIDELLLDELQLRNFTESELQGLGRLRDAVSNEQEVVDSFSHPFYWSAYTLVGSPW